MLSLNKIFFLSLLFYISGCSPKALILMDKKTNEEKPIKIAVLDFYNHSTTSNPRLGRELAERLTYNIFAHSEGCFNVVERNYIKSMLEKADLKFSDTFSKEELLLLADSIDADFLVKGTIIDYSTDIMEKRNNVLEVLISIIFSEDGSTIAMLKLRKDVKNHHKLVESISAEAGKLIVHKKANLQSILNPVTSDTTNAQ